MRVVITGTSSGIGESTAIVFLSRGYEVIGLDVNLSTISHENYTHYVCDISHAEELPDITEVNILINNAGIQTDIDDDRMMEVNFNGVKNCTERYVLQQLPFGYIKSVVNVASADAHTGAEFPLYCASKGAVLAYTKATAKIIASVGATCNSISPGGVVTPLNAPVLDDAGMMSAVMQVTPLQKWASAQEIAEWIYFLSVVNKSMTAQDVVVDNGEMYNHTFYWPNY